MNDETQTIPCDICNEPTNMTGTRLCESCWRISNAIRGVDHLNRLQKILHAQGIVLVKSTEELTLTKFMRYRAGMLTNAHRDHPGKQLIEAIDADFSNHSMRYRVEVGR